MALEEGNLSTRRQASVPALEKELASLRAMVAALAARVDSLEARLAGGYDQTPTEDWPQEFVEELEARKASRQSLLPRVATVCFLLVLALILRTVTDNNIVPVRLGSFIGLGYALALVLAGWVLYARGSRLAAVFPVCGMLLLLAVVLEVHSRFAMLPTLWAHLLLLQALLVVSVVGLRFRAQALLLIGTLGSGFVSLGLDFPDPLFPSVGLVLVTGVVLASLAEIRGISRLLRWAVLFLVLMYWLLWVMKLQVPLGRGLTMPAALYATWFFPVLAMFFLVYLGTAFWRIRGKADGPGVFDSVLPLMNGLWASAAALGVAPGLWSRQAAGLAVVAAALLHLAISSLLARGKRPGGPGTNAFALTGAVLLALGLPFVVGWIGWALVGWWGCSILLLHFSARWQSGGVRLTSYCQQLFCCAAAVTSGALAVGENGLVTQLSLAAFLSGGALWQFRWCRANTPPHAGSVFYSFVDRQDRSAVVLLLVFLVLVFAGLRLILHSCLAGFPGDPVNGFRCGQTILINLGSLALLIAGWRQRNLEIAAVSIGVALLGAGKVFFYDLFTANGLALVLSVFSFGVLAAVGSSVSGRWQQECMKASDV